MKVKGLYVLNKNVFVSSYDGPVFLHISKSI